LKLYRFTFVMHAPGEDTDGRDPESPGLPGLGDSLPPEVEAAAEESAGPDAISEVLVAV